MAPKRPPDQDFHLETKQPKLEPGIAAAPLRPQPSPASDYSAPIKRKLQSSSRTGQACDRCKHRKIRCDPRPEGCSPCAQNNTECTTTDRITGRPRARGQIEAVEAENRHLRAQVHELQTQLKELGANPRLPPNHNGYQESTPWQPPQHGHEGTACDKTRNRRESTLLPDPPIVPSSRVAGTENRPLPYFKPHRVGDNYLGVSSTNSLVSHIKGTSLSIFGTEIDITDLVQGEEDYETSVMSYDHFLRVILREDTDIEAVPMPQYEKLRKYAELYMRTLNPYTMLLDKRTFMALIDRIGTDPSFEPSPTELVCVHMMMATLEYQLAARNVDGGGQSFAQAHKHYRYSLSFFNHLLHGHTWQDIQALSMICHYMRNFPKPGAAWLILSTTFLLAIELGFHRSTKAWEDSGERDPLEIEMRKRIFWALHAMASNLSGKLGRPMPINIEDIDVEFPEPVDDYLPDEQVSSDFQKCSFHVGIHTVKHAVVGSSLFRSVYGVKQSPRDYEDAVRRLEREIQQWRANIPAELADPSGAYNENHIFALYLEYWYLEFQLLLYHPAVCRSTDPGFLKSNLDKCLEVTQKMVHTCAAIIRYKSLDITWIHVVVYIAALSTQLFVYEKRKDQMTREDMDKLKRDMGQWMHVMGTCGKYLRTGDKLRLAVQAIVAKSLREISDSIATRTARESLAQVALQAPPEQPTRTAYGEGNGNGNGNGGASGNVNGNAYAQYQNTDAVSAGGDSSGATAVAAYGGSAANLTYGYNNGIPPTIPSEFQQNYTANQQAYGANEHAGMAASHAAALAAAATQQSNERYAYPHQTQNPPNVYQAQYNTMLATPSDWAMWSRTTVQQQFAPPYDYTTTAATLLPQTAGQDGSAAGGGGGSVLQGQGIDFQSMRWPNLVLSMSNMRGAHGANGHVG
ncbi:uncharacterized protein EI97DRAFT_436355 [Westerdykella ornata]|uniref:Zn(2)-C6 fungal-type domain-containing protein n=1 Tax=Westerdykella ornata TaxID=318751 RepID=A0A6A6JAC0_WESOR|nr:uncharacterized protein EI97DRAFT_436355 [Westerdykella ornata]KAF2273113.1 hypothetical protein EI97DRAFT_436355 [Westerdykella ornata]